MIAVIAIAIMSWLKALFTHLFSADQASLGSVWAGNLFKYR